MIRKFIKHILSKFRFRGRCRIGSMSVVSKQSKFEGMCQIHPNSYFHGSMGIGSYLGSNSFLSANIGRFTSISQYVRCNPGIHPYNYPFVTTSPCFYSLNKNHSQCGSTFAVEQVFDEFKLVDVDKNIAVEIGNDVWIGERVFLVGGIRIGDGAMVLAGAVVTKDVPSYAIVGGVPAKIIKYRYDDDTIQFLKNIKWWNNSIDWFKENWRLMTNIEQLKKYYHK